MRWRIGRNERSTPIPLPSGRPLRVALYAGIFVRFDAVSTSLRRKLEILRRLRAEGQPIELTVFTQGTDYTSPEIIVLTSPDELSRHPAFLAADVHIFEFGMHYELFDAINSLPDGTPILAVDHSTTPPELVDSIEARERCTAAIARREVLRRATHVTSDSEFNRAHLLARGFPPEMLSVLHLPPACSFGDAPIGGAVRGSRHGPIRLLFVGRFVRAKGVQDLLRAVSPLLEHDDVCVTLVGDVRFSDPDILTALRELLGRHDADGRMQLVAGIDDDELGQLYLSSDVFVLPSYHEGYCVPVVEALFAGCYPITYDAGNLPNATGGLGALVPTGDVKAFAKATGDHVEKLRTARTAGGRLSMTTERGELDEKRWRKAVTAHVMDYTPEMYEDTFVRLLGNVVRSAT